MFDPLADLPREDRRALERMAADAEVSPEAMMKAAARAYLALVRACPEALPADPMRRLATGAIGGGAHV